MGRCACVDGANKRSVQRHGEQMCFELNCFFSNSNNGLLQNYTRIPAASEANMSSGTATPRSYTSFTSTTSSKGHTDADELPLPGSEESDLSVPHSSFVVEIKQRESESACSIYSRSQSCSPPPPSSSFSVDIPECTLLTPRSCYEGFEPPDGIQIMSERTALSLLSNALDRISKPRRRDFTELQLDDFVVYNHLDPEEMRSLNHMDTKTRHGSYFFDGILSVAGVKAYVRRVPIYAIPIDNYGSLSLHTVRGHIWLQSQFNFDKDTYYRLGRPAKEYVRFFTPFLWVADLAKHFVDYLKVMQENKRKVSIYHFRSTFAAWLKKAHKHATEFLKWLVQHPSEDYRTSVVANMAFLHKEAVGVLGRDNTYFHTIWAEAWEFTSIPDRPKAVNPPTVVTKYVYDCFKHLPFGDQLEVIQLSSNTEDLRNRLIRQRHMELPHALHNSSKNISVALKEQIRDIKPGDTISTQRDGEGSGSKWKREISRGFSDVDRWFALVQRVRTKKNGLREFDVIWYYRPADTLCALMKYPWNNELFLSNHCSCSERSKIDENEVLGVHDVDFGGTSATTSELFCRQTYLHGERRWITLKPEHLSCPHVVPQSVRGRSPKYCPGDTFLLHLDYKSTISEPCEFVASFREEGQKFYRFRRLLRRKLVDPDAVAARPNELVYSEHHVEVKKTRILGPCFVRFFRENIDIPAPYNCDGVGNFFYITHQEISNGGSTRYIPIQHPPQTLRQGFDPQDTIPKLRGLDLFCGGGNFGRGLEDAAGIEMKWANDYDSKAIHTYMANVKIPENVHPFLGSIDDLQRLAMQGKFTENVPPIGEVDFISGGSPCPGFSRLTNDKTTVQQRKNQSLVATFASFVDLYRPKYGLLENVPGIVQKKIDRDHDVFSQLICALVGLGYQTQFFFLDASSCGSPQRRSRIFVLFAAPECELPKKPTQTHGHPPNTQQLGIGWLPNGQHMATREFPTATPFQYVSAKEATSDLPAIFDAKPDICIAYPDHRVSLGRTRLLRSRIAHIPTRPWGMNFAKAWYGENKRTPASGVMTKAEREFYPGAEAAMDPTKQSFPTRPISSAYGRLHPDRLLETIVTRQSPGDAKNGRQLHWNEDRVLTIMEARRAQGFRDEDVLLGDPASQYKIVGNSVARKVAVALGVVIREAWAATLMRENDERLANGPVTPPEDVIEVVSDLDSNELPGYFDVSLDHPKPVAAGSETTPQSLSAASTGTLMEEHDIVEVVESSSIERKRPHPTSLVIELPGPSKRQKAKTGEAVRSHRCETSSAGQVRLASDRIIID